MTARVAFTGLPLDHQQVTALFGKHHQAQPYDQLVRYGDGRVRPTVYTLGARTGRMSCVRPNCQNVPRTGGVRGCIIADPSYVLISADFAGIELQVAAALSDDAQLARVITEDDAAKVQDPNAKTDIHWKIAREVFGPNGQLVLRNNAGALGVLRRCGAEIG